MRALDACRALVLLTDHYAIAGTNEDRTRFSVCVSSMWHYGTYTTYDPPLGRAGALPILQVGQVLDRPLRAQRYVIVLRERLVVKAAAPMTSLTVCGVNLKSEHVSELERAATDYQARLLNLVRVPDAHLGVDLFRDSYKTLIEPFRVTPCDST